jgi:hypothetical protein
VVLRPLGKPRLGGKIDLREVDCEDVVKAYSLGSQPVLGLFNSAENSGYTHSHSLHGAESFLRS